MLCLWCVCIMIAVLWKSGLQDIFSVVTFNTVKMVSNNVYKCYTQLCLALKSLLDSNIPWWRCVTAQCVDVLTDLCTRKEFADRLWCPFFSSGHGKTEPAAKNECQQRRDCSIYMQRPTLGNTNAYKKHWEISIEKCQLHFWGIGRHHVCFKWRQRTQRFIMYIVIIPL